MSFQPEAANDFGDLMGGGIQREIHGVHTWTSVFGTSRRDRMSAAARPSRVIRVEDMPLTC